MNIEYAVPQFAVTKLAMCICQDKLKFKMRTGIGRCYPNWWLQDWGSGAQTWTIWKAEDSGVAGSWKISCQDVSWKNHPLSQYVLNCINHESYLYIYIIILLWTRFWWWSIINCRPLLNGARRRPVFSGMWPWKKQVKIRAISPEETWGLTWFSPSIILKIKPFVVAIFVN